MSFNDPLIVMWEEVASSIKSIIMPQRHSALPSEQTGLNLNSQPKEANLKKTQTIVAEGHKGGGSNNLGENHGIIAAARLGICMCEMH
jgi:hypothetical protein